VEIEECHETARMTTGTPILYMTFLCAGIDEQSIGCMEAKGSAMELLFGAVTAYISQYFIPGLVWIVAAVLSLSRWRQHPRVSRLTLTAILIFLADSLVSVFAGIYVSWMQPDSGPAIGMTSLYFTFLGLLSSVMRAAAWSFIVAAIFSQREKA
jgi:hypothetical protein